MFCILASIAHLIIPGNASILLICTGTSDLHEAYIYAPASSAISIGISGLGLDNANTNGLSAIALISSAVMISGLLTHTNISAHTMTSLSDPSRSSIL